MCCMSMICNVLTQESIDSLSVKKIGGLYMCGRLGLDGRQGSLKAANVLCVNMTLSFWYQSTFQVCKLGSTCRSLDRMNVKNHVFV
jgi:hypothetical protein